MEVFIVVFVLIKIDRKYLDRNMIIIIKN